jgi:hypothetical protein
MKHMMFGNNDNGYSDNDFFAHDAEMEARALDREDALEQQAEMMLASAWGEESALDQALRQVGDYREGEALLAADQARRLASSNFANELSTLGTLSSRFGKRVA